MGFTTPTPFGQVAIMHGNSYYFTALQNWECIGCVWGVTNLQCAFRTQCISLEKQKRQGKLWEKEVQKYKLQNMHTPFSLLMQRASIFPLTPPNIFPFCFVKQLGCHRDTRQIGEDWMSIAFPPYDTILEGRK